jgi:hypothetical protein
MEGKPQMGGTYISDVGIYAAKPLANIQFQMVGTYPAFG